MNIKTKILTQVKKAKKASFELSFLSTKDKDKALKNMATALWEQRSYIIRENMKDLTLGQQKGLSSALMDRLTLNEKRIQLMSQGFLDIMKLKDPVGEVLESQTRPNGLVIHKIRVPIGVVGVIYESRPNVTADCAALCLKSGNAVILKGGKEAFYSNKAIYLVLSKALVGTKVPVDAIQFISFLEREAVAELLKMNEYIDVIIPRGGEGLIHFVAQHSSIPVIKHYKGVCHVYVDSKADLTMAKEICMNAKVQRPGVCNAMETLLVDEKIAKKFLSDIGPSLIKAGVELRLDQKASQIILHMKKATTADWSTEYLDLILSVKVVKGVKEAIEHINCYGSRHSDAIVTKNKKAAVAFLKGVDSACVYLNASTRFTDGYEFGLGAEIGISTDKLHVRGPMGLEGLTSYKYEILGNGHIR